MIPLVIAYLVAVLLVLVLMASGHWPTTHLHFRRLGWFAAWWVARRRNHHH